jgi:methylmalonyl-CoA mutase C-terminal domain/subunit
LRLLRKRNAEDIFVFAGGIIPKKDIAKLKKIGVLEIFTPGAETSEVIHFVRNTINERMN